MALVTLNDANLVAIADAIREKGVEGNFTPSQMAPAIASIMAGAGGCMYESAEAMYQAIRPKSWPELPDAKSFMVDIVEEENLFDWQAFTAIVAVPASVLNTNVKYQWVPYNAFFSMTLRLYNIVDGQLNLIASNTTNNNITIVYPDNSIVDEYGRYIFVLAGLYRMINPIFQGRYGTYTPSMPYCVDVDWYFNGRSWSGNGDACQYATYNLDSTTFKHCEFLRIKVLEPGYLYSTSSTNLCLSTNTFGGSSSSLKILRECDLAIDANPGNFSFHCGPIWVCMPSNIPNTLFTNTFLCPIEIIVSEYLNSICYLPFLKSYNAIVYAPKFKVTFNTPIKVGSNSSIYNIGGGYTLYPYSLPEFEFQGSKVTSNIIISVYNGMGFYLPGQIYNLCKQISNIQGAGSVTKTISRLHANDLTPDEITELQELGWTITFR